MAPLPPTFNCATVVPGRQTWFWVGPGCGVVFFFRLPRFLPRRFAAADSLSTPAPRALTAPAAATLPRRRTNPRRVDPAPSSRENPSSPVAFITVLLAWFTGVGEVPTSEVSLGRGAHNGSQGGHRDSVNSGTAGGVAVGLRRSEERRVG